MRASARESIPGGRPSKLVSASEALAKQKKFNVTDKLKAVLTGCVAIPGHADAPESTPTAQSADSGFSLRSNASDFMAGQALVRFKGKPGGPDGQHIPGFQRDGFIGRQPMTTHTNRTRLGQILNPVQPIAQQ